MAFRFLCRASLCASAMATTYAACSEPDAHHDDIHSVRDDLEQALEAVNTSYVDKVCMSLAKATVEKKSQLESRVSITREAFVAELAQAHDQAQLQHLTRKISEIEATEDLRLASFVTAQTVAAVKERDLMVEAYREEMEKQAAEQQQAVAELEEQVRQSALVIQQLSAAEEARHKAHVLLASLLPLELSLTNQTRDGKLALLQQCDQLLALEDPVITAALSAIPRDALEDGVSSLKVLQDRFPAVSTAVLETSYVTSTGHGKPSIWGHAMARVFAWATVKPENLRSLTGHEEWVDQVRVHRAEYWLKRGQLAECVQELEALSPQCARPACDFVSAAKTRMQLQMAVAVIRSYAASVETSYA